MSRSSIWTQTFQHVLGLGQIPIVIHVVHEIAVGRQVHERTATVRSRHLVAVGSVPDRLVLGNDGRLVEPDRAAEVLDFFDDEGLTPEFLRRVSQHQIGLLSRCFDDLDADPGVIDRDRSVRLDGLGGFLALTARRAEELCRVLRERGVMTDYRADVLRLGPAPYLSDAQLTAAMDALGSAVRALS